MLSGFALYYQHSQYFIDKCSLCFMYLFLLKVWVSHIFTSLALHCVLLLLFVREAYPPLLDILLFIQIFNWCTISVYIYKKPTKAVELKLKKAPVPRKQHVQVKKTKHVHVFSFYRARSITGACYLCFGDFFSLILGKTLSAHWFILGYL